MNRQTYALQSIYLKLKPGSVVLCINYRKQTTLKYYLKHFECFIRYIVSDYIISWLQCWKLIYSILIYLS